MTFPTIVCAALTLISAAVSFGFSIVAIGSAVGAARPLALYAAVRSAALLASAAGSFFVPQLGWLFALAVTMIIVQAGDAFVGITTNDRLKTVGPALTSLANLAALIWALLPG